MSGSGLKTLTKFGIGRETLLYFREVLSDVREYSGGLPGGPGVVGMPSRMSGSGRETHPNVREWSRNPPGCSGGLLECPGEVGRTAGCPRVVKRLSRMSGSGQEALSDVRECSGDLAECPGVVGKPSWMFGRSS